MLAIQSVRWGKIQIGRPETYPPPDSRRFVVFLRSGTIFIGTGFTDLVWKSGGRDFVMQDGDLWMQIPDPPEKLCRAPD